MLAVGDVVVFVRFLCSTAGKGVPAPTFFGYRPFWCAARHQVRDVVVFGCLLALL